MGAGEGSRGGKVVGHTSTGRAIYAKEATAKAAMGMDPHPGVRQSTPHAPIVDRGFPRSAPRMQTAATHGGLTGSQWLQPKTSAGATKAEGLSAAANALSAGIKARGGASEADHRQAAAAHEKASDAHTAIGRDSVAHDHQVQAVAHTQAANNERDAATARAPFNAGPSDPVHGGSGRNQPAYNRDANKESTSFETMRNKGHDISERAFRTGSAEDHKAALQMQTKLAKMAKGSPAFEKYHLERADQHREALGQKLRPRGNLDRPAVMNKPGYRGR